MILKATHYLITIKNLSLYFNILSDFLKAISYFNNNQNPVVGYNNSKKIFTFASAIENTQRKDAGVVERDGLENRCTFQVPRVRIPVFPQPSLETRLNSGFFLYQPNQ